MRWSRPRIEIQRTHDECAVLEEHERQLCDDALDRAHSRFISAHGEAVQWTYKQQLATRSDSRVGV